MTCFWISSLKFSLSMVVQFSSLSYSATVRTDYMATTIRLKLPLLQFLSSDWFIDWCILIGSVFLKALTKRHCFNSRSFAELFSYSLDNKWSVLPKGCALEIKSWNLVEHVSDLQSSSKSTFKQTFELCFQLSLASSRQWQGDPQ